MKRIILLLAILLSFTVPANALLESNGDGTITQTRNDGSMFMWLRDANYAVTSGYEPNAGFMNWAQANQWINSLNNSNHLGYNDWRLPATNPVNGSTFDYNFSYDGSTDYGHNIGAPGTVYEGSTGSEMAYMFYTELGNLGQYDTSGSSRDCLPNCMTNTGPFINLENVNYWSGTEYAPNPNYAWHFSFYNGKQDDPNKGTSLRTWAVRDVTVVPEPISSILFLTGAGVLAGRRYFRRRNEHHLQVR